MAMKLTIEAPAFPLPDTVFRSVAINCWTDDVPPERFMIVIAEPYAEKFKWDLSQGLRDAVELHYDELLSLAQMAADKGESGLFLT